VSDHTPGPWAIAGDSDDDSVVGVIAADYREICRTSCSLDDAGNYAATDEDRANCRLIAAAPDLLLALKSAMRHGGMPECFCDKDDPTYQCNGCFARAAIAKAEGRVE